MKFILLTSLVLIALGGRLSAQAPLYYPSNFPELLGNGADTLPNPFTGGLMHPLFSNIDLNMDGRQDVVIVDVGNNQGDAAVYPFLSVQHGANFDLAYAPQYNHLFPRLKGWAFFADFNNDGKKDLFTYGEIYGQNGKIVVFKNTGTDSVAFQLYRSPLKTLKKPNITDPISTNFVELPTFTDVDNDGDLDILAFDPAYNSTIFYYRNVAKDSSWSSDSLNYVLVDRCWGRFYEVGSGDTLVLGDACSQFNAYHRAARLHAGSTIAAFDFDADGDKDLVIGDAGFNNVMFAQNTRLPVFGAPKMWDTVGQFMKNFPAGKNINLYSMPLAAMVDVTGDGKADMLVTPIDQGSKRRNIVWYYQNTGGYQPIFTYRDSAFLEKTMLDLGDNSAPCFLDYDNDGKTDLLLSAESEKNGIEPTEQVYYYHNVGTRQKPVFKLQDPDFLGLSSALLYRMALTVGDVNNDGRPDLLIGSANGKVYYFLNQAASGFQFSGTGNYLQDDNASLIDVGDYSVPTLGDLDGDGKTDLLVGNKQGYISYYQNTGTATPKYKKITDIYAGISSVGDMAPCLAKLDGDDSIDLVTASKNGKVTFYRNVSASTLNPVPATGLFAGYNGKGINSLTLQGGIPAAGQLDQDSTLDLAFGMLRGGLLIYSSRNNTYTLPAAGLTEVYAPTLLRMRLYPNPASDEITLSFDDLEKNGRVEVSITDILGRQLKTVSFNAPEGMSEKIISLEGLLSGMYLVRVALPSTRKSASFRVMVRG